MAFKEGYFELLVGAVTMDAYQPVQGRSNQFYFHIIYNIYLGGVVYVVGCTHGYDRQSLHLASRFPRKLPSHNLLGIFPRKFWLAIIATVFMLTSMIILALYMHTNANTLLVKSDLDVTQIMIRLVAGFTEPDKARWFKTFSTGK